MIELLPFLLVIQFSLDVVMHGLGSSIIVFGNLAAITSIVRGSWFPAARIRR